MCAAGWGVGGGVGGGEGGLEGCVEFGPVTCTSVGFPVPVGRVPWQQGETESRQPSSPPPHPTHQELGTPFLPKHCCIPPTPYSPRQLGAKGAQSTTRRAANTPLPAALLLPILPGWGEPCPAWLTEKGGGGSNKAEQEGGCSGVGKAKSGEDPRGVSR